MVDAVLDESWILKLLRTAPSTEHDNVARLQSGAMQTLLDLYDRKVTRDEFIHASATCVALFGSCSKIGLLGNIETVFRDDNLTQETFDVATRALEDLVRQQAVSVEDLVKRLQMCPPTVEPLH